MVQGYGDGLATGKVRRFGVKIKRAALLLPLQQRPEAHSSSRADYPAHLSAPSSRLGVRHADRREAIRRRAVAQLTEDILAPAVTFSHSG